MKTLKINDLETRKELNESAMMTIKGGSNISGQGGLFAPVSAGLGGFFNTQIVTSVPINTPVNVQLDLDTDLGIDTSVANVIASAASGIAQR